MQSLLGGYSLWQYFSCFLDMIPRAIYFIYASIASCLDALQCLLRRLAGLDVYYVKNGSDFWGNNYDPVKGQDPVVDFIYGILGIGDRAAPYSALNTVFWSLAIFAVIMLAVATMIAILKGHYQEDVAKTSPVQYIYTAIKAILTFAIVPFAVIIGLQLSSFMLKTMDQITAGSASAESISGIYGESAKDKLKHSSDNYYSRYDYFGIGDYTNTTSFSGLMFKAAAYDCNRVRRGVMGEVSSEGLSKCCTFDLFGQSDSLGLIACKDDAERREYIAYQIDYAFQNNFYLEKGVYGPTMYEITDVFITIPSVDKFALVNYIWTFSKFNTGLIWYYYDLWSFNFFIGFGTIMIAFGIFISIIAGMMSRLIRMAILFIIYAPTLSIAPIDEFGAFKKWRSDFIQQTLMAFGSILGMNLFFLILPYLSNISFFGWTFIDSLVNVFMVIIGLAMIKELIGFISGLVGGADALKIGEGFQKEAKDKGIGKVVAGMGAGVARLAMAPVKALTKQGWNLHKADKEKKMSEKYDKLNQDMLKDSGFENKEELDKTREKFSSFKNADEAGQAAFDKALADGYDVDTAYNAKNEAEKEFKKLKKFDEAGGEETYNRRAEISKNATERMNKIAEANHFEKNENGEWVATKSGVKAELANSFREGAGVLKKALLDGIGPALQLDGLKGIFQAMDNVKRDKDGNVVGESWKTKQYAKEDFAIMEAKANRPKFYNRAYWNEENKTLRRAEKDMNLNEAFPIKSGINRNIDVKQDAAKDTAKNTKDMSTSMTNLNNSIGEMKGSIDRMADAINNLKGGMVK